MLGCHEGMTNGDISPLHVAEKDVTTSNGVPISSDSKKKRIVVYCVWKEIIRYQKCTRKATKKKKNK